ncbi:three-helix bundle dimerization domain-containing protein [Gordonia terrae]|uniref:three-helix bundle dimerization domain-containing protein n=1 Tax=Gordonia terrae TaxID=2055 RepID=UPI0015DFE122|nr:hypothetical protein [Gordonia terrae]
MTSRFLDEPAAAGVFPQNVPMARVEEMLEVEQVIRRLIARFPVMAVDDINARVRAIHGRFADCKVRIFVPLLIEKAARRDIEDFLAQPDHLTLVSPTPGTTPRAPEVRADEVA